MNRTCRYWTDGRCTNDCAVSLYGRRPSVGTCERACPHHSSGKDRKRPDVTHSGSGSGGTMGAKAWSWTKAIASIVRYGQVPAAVFAHRHACCTGRTPEGEVIGDACPAMEQRTDDDGAVRRYCKACGCPKWSMAELMKKLRFPHCPCPRHRFSNWPAQQVTIGQSDSTTVTPSSSE